MYVYLHNDTWYYTDGQFLEYFACESMLLGEEVDLGAEFSLEAVEHGVLDHEVAQLGCLPGT